MRGEEKNRALDTDKIVWHEIKAWVDWNTLQLDLKGFNPALTVSLCFSSKQFCDHSYMHVYTDDRIFQQTVSIFICINIVKRRWLPLIKQTEIVS